VIAAVSVVLPWSIWPIVPMLTCGFVRSNFFFATCAFYSIWRGFAAKRGWSPQSDLNR
jgi:hypothetical protein